MRPLETLTRQERGSRRAEVVELDSVDSDFKPGLRVQAIETLKAVRGEESAAPTICEALPSMRLVEALFGLDDV